MKRFLNNIYLTVRTIDNLYLFIGDYLGLVNGDIIYKIRNKPYKFIARAGTSDKDEIVAVMSGFEYRFDVLPKIINPIIFDIGAYLGDSAIFTNDYFNNQCTIYSFEPDSDNYRYCLLNILLNDIKSIKCFQVALSSKNGKGFLERKDLQRDAYRLGAKKNKDSINCETKSLIQITKELKVEKIDILKMDIEGGEYDIFNNTKSYLFIKEKVKYIFLEYHYDFGEKLVHLLFKKLSKDYNILHHRDNLICLENKHLVI